jgi:hypothetical protein
MDNTRLLIITFFVGFFGDTLLQLGSKYGMGGPTGWGLKEYFEQHGSVESLIIAGGMMTLFYSILMILKVPINFQTLIVYGIFLDLLFRKFRIFPSLDGYYKYLGYIGSAFWEALSMSLPLLVYNYTQ